jgi:multiple sugar transport system substrate-binding protein
MEDWEDILEGYRIENSSYPDGKFYSLPCNKSTEVLYYNKTFFEANELTVPTTWDELKDVSMAATEILGAPAFGYDSLQNLFITWTQQAGGQYTNSDGEVLFDSAEAREALQYFVDGVDGGYFRSAGEDNYMSGPFNDQAAVMFIGSTSGSAYVGSDEFVWDSAQVPFGKVKKVIQQGSNMFMLKSTPEEQLATFEFMKYITSTEITAYWAMNTGYLPVRTSARESADYVAFVESGVNPTKVTGTSYEAGWYIFDPIFPDSYSYRVAAGTAVEEAIAGTKTVDQAVTDAANSIG